MLDTLKEELAAAIDYLKEQNMRFMQKGSMTLLDHSNSLLVVEPKEVATPTDPDSMLVADFSGSIIEGTALASASLPAHLEIYRAFPGVGAIVHSHGMYTTAWAQAGRDIPVYGTSHLDVFKDAVPCTRAITAAEAENGYETAAGLCVAEIFQKKALNPETVPAALLFQHGAFIWGRDAMEAASRCVILEQIAHLAYLTEKINPDIIDVRRNITPRGL